MRVAFWGNFGTGNWGNECTLQAIVHNAQKHVPEAELLCVCSEPEDTERRHGLTSFPISIRRRTLGRVPKRSVLPVRVLRRLSNEVREWARAFELASRTDVLVMTGTGMLTDCSEGPFGLPYDMFKWSVATRALGGRLRFASVGVEPIAHPVARFFITTSLRLADYRSYRDGQSREHLRRIGFPSDIDAVYPDLAFSLPESTAQARLRSPRKPPKVAVGLYDYASRGQGGEASARAYGDYLDKIGSFVLWLLEQGYPVRLLIGDLTYDQGVLDDVKAWLKARGASRYGGQLEDEAATSVQEVIAQIEDVDIVVASRFHNVLLSLLLAKPVVSISYNEKNDALMAEMGLGEYCQSIDEFRVDRLIEQTRAVERDEARLRPALVDKATAYRAALEQQYARLFGS